MIPFDPIPHERIGALKAQLQLTASAAEVALAHLESGNVELAKASLGHIVRCSKRTLTEDEQARTGETK